MSERTSNFTAGQSTSLPFERCWTFGHDLNVPVHNASDENRTSIIFASGMVIVAYDWINNTQILLEGHSNDVCFMVVSSNKRWLATADKGPHCSIAVWNVETNESLRFIDDFSEGSITCMEFLPDGLQLLIVSDGHPQKLFHWNWTNDDEVPQILYEYVGDVGVHSFITIHTNDSSHFLTSSKSMVTFFKKDLGKLEVHSPLFDQKDLKKGHLTETSYVIDSQLVITATTNDGAFLVWGNSEAFGVLVTKSVFVEPNNRFLYRIMHPHIEKESIVLFRSWRSWLISTNTSGYIYFYDSNLRVVHNLKNLKCGVINQISFAKDTDDGSFPNDKRNPQNFAVTNFSLSTVDGFCGYFVADQEKLVPILYPRKYLPVIAACSVIKPHLCIGDLNGEIQIWNYLSRKLEARVFLHDPLMEIECLDFDPTSLYLACGSRTGTAQVLDYPNLSLPPQLNYYCGKRKVTLCKFSPDSQFLVFVDDTHCVTLFRLFCIIPRKSFIKKKEKETAQWDYLCKYRAHYLPIVDVVYKEGEKSLLLFTLGEDRKLVMYDIFECRKDSMAPISTFSVEQCAIPTCMSMYPFFENGTLISVANNQHKLKIIDFKTENCFKLNAMPLYDSPVKKMNIIEDQRDGVEKPGQKYFIFRTDHNIGLLQLPVDGNPFKALAVRVHPLGIKDVVFSLDGKFAFTCGISDNWVGMFRVNFEAVEASIERGGTGIDPYLSLVPEASSKGIKDEIMNIAFALQLQKDEHEYLQEITLRNELLIDELDYFLTALGYFPTKYELSIFMEDVKFSYIGSLDNDDERKHIIPLDDFIKLYANHCPVEPVTMESLSEAFKLLSGVKGDNPSMPRSYFLKVLDDDAEVIKHREMRRLISVLTDHAPPDKDINELFVSYDRDESYYAGEDWKPEPLTLDDLAEDEDWGHLDRRHSSIGTTMAAEPVVDLNLVDDQIKEFREPKIKPMPKSLVELLPASISKEVFLQDILGFIPRKEQNNE